MQHRVRAVTEAEQTLWHARRRPWQARCCAAGAGVQANLELLVNVCLQVMLNSDAALRVPDRQGLPHLTYLCCSQL